MLNSIVARRRRRDAIQQLSRLSDRRLDDLGIDRADIAALVDRAAIMSGGTSLGRAGAVRSTDWGDGMAPSWAVHNRRALIA